MNLSDHSKNRIMKTFSKWHVPKEFADPMYSYLIHGYNPGSCFTSVLANDFVGAIARSHPGNTIGAFKALAGWMRDTMPCEAYGSYKAVDDWCYLKEDARRVILEEHELIYTAKEELFMTIKEPSPREIELF
jgi:hypothetical protein